MGLFRILVAAYVVAILVSPAHAHTGMTYSNIEAGSELVETPKTFEISFGGKVGLAAIELQTSEGDSVNFAFERPRHMGKAFSIPMPSLSPGSYILTWRAVAKDGHVMKGEMAFAVVS
jgi:copper resistance protein C